MGDIAQRAPQIILKVTKNLKTKPLAVVTQFMREVGLNANSIIFQFV
jgi:hypothetical protein